MLLCIARQESLHFATRVEAVKLLKLLGSRHGSTPRRCGCALPASTSSGAIRLALTAEALTSVGVREDNDHAVGSWESFGAVAASAFAASSLVLGLGG